jgi:hypothetical protein
VIVIAAYSGFRAADDLVPKFRRAGRRGWIGVNLMLAGWSIFNLCGARQTGNIRLAPARQRGGRLPKKSTLILKEVDILTYLD